MLSLGPEWLTIILFGSLVLLLMAGLPLVFAIGGVATLEPIRKEVESPESDVIPCPLGRFVGARDGMDSGTSTRGGSAWAALPV